MPMPMHIHLVGTVSCLAATDLLLNSSFTGEEL